MLPRISSFWTLSGGKRHRNAALAQTVFSLSVTLLTLVNCAKSEFGEAESTVVRLFLLRHFTVLSSRWCPQKRTTPKTTNVGTDFEIGKTVLTLTPLKHSLIPLFLIPLNLFLRPGCHVGPPALVDPFEVNWSSASAPTNRPPRRWSDWSSWPSSTMSAFMTAFSAQL